MVDIGLATNLQQFAILFAAFAGNFIATLPPFWKEQFKFKEYDIRIFFDYKFAGTALVTGIGAFVFVSSILNSVIASIPQDATLVLALISAFTIGLLGNKGVNALLPSPNQEAKAKVAEIQEQKILDNFEKEKKLQSVIDVETNQNSEQANKTA